MYQTIAKVYDYIFPTNKKQLSFIESIKPIQKDERIIEIGCATGNLTAQLKTKASHVTGLDLDNELLNVAISKHENILFQNMNMLDIDRMENTFNRIICFGNTLVHLPNRQMVLQFFEKVHNQLDDDGLFITQIINYDRIYNQSLKGLPTIENDHIKFERAYDLERKYVNFNTVLTIKENGEVITNSIPLLNLREEEIKNMLQTCGFVDITFYGGLDGSELTDQSTPLLFSARKK